MSHLERALKIMLGHEGGYVNDPEDPGGETNWGITIAVARENGYHGPMIDLPLEKAVDIYSKKYWDTRLDRLPFMVVFNIFDAAVNHGKRQSFKLAQRAAGCHDDGFMGPDTLEAISSIGPWEFCAKFNAERIEFYTDLKTFKRFGRGWVRRVAGNLRIK